MSKHKKKAKTVGLTGLGVWGASKIGFFKLFGLLIIEDTLAMRLGELYGVTISNLILITSFSLLIYGLQKNGEL